MVLDALIDTAKDSWLLLLLLFLTYIVMEYLEHKAGARTQATLRKAGRLGPVFGALLGAVPQCGISAAASNLYAGRVITLGTLLSLYLSTSDEMLPVMLSAQVPVQTIAGILGIKIFIGLLIGFITDAVLCTFRKGNETQGSEIHTLCEHSHCDCEHDGIMRSALKHTAQIGLFAVLITFAINLLLAFIGEDSLTGLLLDKPILGPIIAGLIGFIPNCAASVILTELYLNGVIGIGSMLAGLLTGTGVGLLVLFRINPRRAENLKIAALLYGIGITVGITAEYIF